MAYGVGKGMGDFRKNKITTFLKWSSGIGIQENEKAPINQK